MAPLSSLPGFPHGNLVSREDRVSAVILLFFFFPGRPTFDDSIEVRWSWAAHRCSVNECLKVVDAGVLAC